MAEFRRSNKALLWQRLPDGRFAIAVNVTATLLDGSQSQTPEMMFILSKDEEAELKKALTGIQVVSIIPNGHAWEWKE